MSFSKLFAAVLVAACSCVAFAQPSSVEHTPASQTFGEVSGITQREPDVPREEEAVTLFFRVSFQFTYDKVCIYYTTDGTEPSGAFGAPSGTTQVLTNDAGTITFVRNENSGGTRDWWKGTLPAGTRAYAKNIKYRISAWKPFAGGEVFANGGSAYSYFTKLAWPGRGAGNANPGEGYPPISFYKEEAIFGNNYCAGQLDQNGTLYDFHFPTPGGIYGVGTRNEGYVDGIDTFPPGLPQGWRGQMHINQAMVGIRTPGDGLTHWLSNPAGVSYNNIHQSYVPTSNTILTSQTLYANGNNISVSQVDFAPAGINWPADQNFQPQRNIYIKRLTLTNNTANPQDVNVYWYMDPALNGGDGYDAMFVDYARGAMVAYDNTYRVVTGTGTGFTDPNEYNPTTAAGYTKDKSLYLASAMKVNGSGGGTVSAATEFWRDSSQDNNQGWMGLKWTLSPGVPVTIDILSVGVHDDFAGATQTYNVKAANIINWLYNTDIGLIRQITDLYWTNWLNSGTTISTPDADFNNLMTRGLLATALHCDAVNGGVIAGFHNGAYPYVWPRDAVYAAITLARTGHLLESFNVYKWMRDTCYRDFENWNAGNTPPGNAIGNNPLYGTRKGYWKQKYSTDGYVIWGAPQIDETAVLPWGLYFHYKMNADSGLLGTFVDQVRDAVYSSTQTSIVDPSRLNVSFGLMYSNNVWEDSYDTFIYSNANVHRGLKDAASIFNVLGLSSEAAIASGKANALLPSLNARLDWNGENTDISQLGIAYPFESHSPTDARVAKVVDRINGIATDTFGNNHPLINFGGQHQDTINRYWGDNYWNGGPWFLSTLWYGLYYAQRADFTAGKGDIDNHKYRMDLMIDRLGPAGMGAEQISYNNSISYPNFVLQTAWPNAWESMSTFVDSAMAFLDYDPDAPNQKMNFRPKLPSAWSTMTFNNVILEHQPSGKRHQVDVTVTENTAPANKDVFTHSFRNDSGFALGIGTVVRVPANASIAQVLRNSQPVAFTYNAALGAVSVNTALETGAGSMTSIVVVTGCPADLNGDGFVDDADFVLFAAAYDTLDCADPGMPSGCPSDLNADGLVEDSDFVIFAAAYDALLCP
ncbi:MAG: glycoside hydrolase family 15 protein [Phycisphaerales bacterium]